MRNMINVLILIKQFLQIATQVPYFVEANNKILEKNQVVNYQSRLNVSNGSK